MSQYTYLCDEHFPSDRWEYPIGGTFLHPCLVCGKPAMHMTDMNDDLLKMQKMAGIRDPSTGDYELLDQLASTADNLLQQHDEAFRRLARYDVEGAKQQLGEVSAALGILTPEQAAEKMRMVRDNHIFENRINRADELVCEVLESLGYDGMVQLFRETR